MPQVKDNHPSAEQLEAYGLGRLDPTQQESLDKHIAGCTACCKKLESLGPDALVALVQSARQTASALEGAETLTGRDKPDAAPPGPMDAGVPAELRDHARFHVLGMLGAGGMGSVYKAEHRLMERMVALKIISKRILDNPAAIERFQREVKAAAKLSHPNIVAAYDAEKLGDTHMLVMEYVKGQSLAEYVERKGPLPVTYACHFIRQAALGLQHAHELGMVHRDLKPQNLMLTPKGAVKILDFGLARMVSETAQGGGLTQENALMGTPDFIAPEQATDARTADIRSDIYSLGCTLYFLLTAQPPFPEGTAIQKVLAHLERKPKSVSELRKEMPAQVVAILDRMLAKKPAQRYQTPAQVAQALTPFARLNAAPGESEVAPKPAPAAKKPAGPIPLLKYAAKAFIKVSGNAVGFGIGGDFLVEVAPRIIDEIWKGWGGQKNEAQRKAELAALALLSSTDMNARAEAIINEIAADQPSAVKEAARSYLTQLPALVRKSLERPSDPTGTTFPANFALANAEDLQPFLTAMPTESPVLALRSRAKIKPTRNHRLLVGVGAGAP